MCTAIFDTKYGNFFGRTLDLEYSLGEEVVICPRNFRIKLCHEGDFSSDYAIVGVAHVRDGVPLYYDGVNEAGIAAAGLNFPISARYSDPMEEKINLASFELIPYVLGRCESLSAVKRCLSNVNITKDAFSPELPPTPLHWIFADKEGSLVLESTESGVKIHENPVGVLANEPSFDFQLMRLGDYMSLGALPPKNSLTLDFEPTLYSRGLGAFGLPGDFSSVSRFVRAVFVKNHTVGERWAGGARFFRMMDSVSVPCGCIITDEGRAVKTVYTACIDLDKLTYYFTTYSHTAPRAVQLRGETLSSDSLSRFSMDGHEDVFFLN